MQSPPPTGRSTPDSTTVEVPESGTGKPLVCSFYTPNSVYEARALRLEASAEALGLDHQIEPIVDRGRWVENVSQKASFMLKVAHMHDRPLLWVDADGWLERHPDLLYDCPADFAIRAEFWHRESRRPVGRATMSVPENWPKDHPPCWFNSGTVFINNTEGGTELLVRWAFLADQQPRAYQQWILMQAWADVCPRTRFLPRMYCHIPRIHGPDKRAVVLHDLASVEQKVRRT